MIDEREVLHVRVRDKRTNLEVFRTPLRAIRQDPRYPKEKRIVNVRILGLGSSRKATRRPNSSAAA